jgi:hypothetical protein
MIHQNYCHHRFSNRGSAYADTGVMTAFRNNINSLASLIDTFAWQPQTGGRF